MPVSRRRSGSLQDRVVEPAVAAPARFRVLAVEPHGWSTALVESEQGATFLISTATQSLSELPREEAERLVDERHYRLWNGDRTWRELAALPLVSAASFQPQGDGESETTY